MQDVQFRPVDGGVYLIFIAWFLDENSFSD